MPFPHLRLLESHLYSIHAEATPTPVSVHEEVPPRLLSGAGSRCCSTTASGSWVRWSSAARRKRPAGWHKATHRCRMSHKLLIWALLLVAVIAAKGIFQFLTRWIVIGISRDIEFDLRNDLFRHLERLSYSYYQRTRTGDIMARATNDLNAVRMLLGPAIMYSANTAGVHRRRAGLHDQHQPPADALRLSAAARRQHRHPVFRPPHSRALRAHPGHVLRHLRPRPGEFLRRPHHPRLRPGRSRDRLLRDRQPGIHPPQPEAGPPDGHAVADAGTDARAGGGARALAGRTPGAAGPHDASAISSPSTPTWCSSHGRSSRWAG